MLLLLSKTEGPLHICSVLAEVTIVGWVLYYVPISIVSKSEGLVDVLLGCLVVGLADVIWLVNF